MSANHPASIKQQLSRNSIILEAQHRKMNTLVLSHIAERSAEEANNSRAVTDWGHHHDKTLRASVSILSSSFTPSRPPWIFSGLSSTSTLLVNGSNLTEKGRLILDTYPLVKDIKKAWKKEKKVRYNEFISEVPFNWLEKVPSFDVVVYAYAPFAESGIPCLHQCHCKDIHNALYFIFTTHLQTFPCWYFLIQCGRDVMCCILLESKYCQNTHQSFLFCRATFDVFAK